MTEEDRERTMNFILEQQAQFAAGMQKSEERMQRFEEGMQRLEQADVRADRRWSKLERTVILIVNQFRHERRDLRGRISALVNAQIKSEDRLAASDARLTRLERITERNITTSDERFLNTEERLMRIEEMIERNNTLSEKRLARIEDVAERNIESIQALEEITRRNSVDIGELAKIVARKQNGDSDGH